MKWILALLLLLVVEPLHGAKLVIPSLEINGERFREVSLGEADGKSLIVLHTDGVAHIPLKEIPPLQIRRLEKRVSRSLTVPPVSVRGSSPIVRPRLEPKLVAARFTAKAPPAKPIAYHSAFLAQAVERWNGLTSAIPMQLGSFFFRSRLLFIALAILLAVMLIAVFLRPPRNAPARVRHPRTSYEILGCSPTDSLASIKSRYRNLVKRHHPDVLAAKGASKKAVDKAAEQFRAVQQAYEAIELERSSRVAGTPL